MKEETFKIRFSNYMKDLYRFKKVESMLSENHNWAPGRLPFDNGDLSQVAFTMEKIDDSHYRLRIDTAVTPYAISVNERQNFYTHNYWQYFARSIAENIAMKYNGSMMDESDPGGKKNG